MLTDSREIEIISRAEQKNVRNPNRSRKHFERIFEDFLSNVPFEGRKFLDLGPGQYDFGVLSQERGANVYAIDKDPAVIELGEYKGFTIVPGRLEAIRADQFDTQFDGVFCKYSLSAFWFENDEKHWEHIQELGKLIKPGGWAWIAPWNGAHESLPPQEVTQILKTQIDAYRALGFWAVDLTDEATRYYGVHGDTANRPLFCLNLPKPRSIKDCPELGIKKGLFGTLRDSLKPLFG